MSVFALIAAIIAFLIGLGVLDSTPDVNWAWIAIAFFFLHFGVELVLPRYWERRPKQE
jgi:hypothetical protein